mgnify:CR=1 FL=1
MRILIINGSPRGKNSSSLRLTMALAEGLRREGDEVETVDISKLDIQGCRGCFGCWASGGTCVIKDDFFAIFKERYLPSELVIWSFPLYFYGIPSKLKAFIDRKFINDWPDMTLEKDGSPTHPSRWDDSHISHIVVSTCGFFTAEGLYDAVLANFRLMHREKFKEAITCGEGGCFINGKSSEFTARYLELVKKAGGEYRQKGSFSEETRAALMQPVEPHEQYLKASQGANPLWKYSQRPKER